MEFINIDLTRLIYIDETGVSVCTRRRRGRSLVGITPIRTVRKIRAQNYNICAAMMHNKMFHFEVERGTYNGESFLLFMKNLIKKLEENNLREIIFIVDNCQIHKKEDLSKYITEKKPRLKIYSSLKPFP